MGDDKEIASTGRVKFYVHAVARRVSWAEREVHVIEGKRGKNSGKGIPWFICCVCGGLRDRWGEWLAIDFVRDLQRAVAVGG